MEITKHRNWNWFLRLIKDLDINLYNRLLEGSYNITQDEKNHLLEAFDLNSGFVEIVNTLEVI